MVALWARIRSEALVQQEVDKVLENVNSAMYSLLAKEGFFATIIVGKYWPATGRMQLVRGGHLLPLWFVGKGLGKIPELRGMSLGVVPSPVYETEEIIIEPGQSILFITDGVTEARNESDELFASDRLLTSLHLIWSERMERLFGYLMAVGLLLLPTLAITADSSAESAPKEMSVMVGLFAKHVDQSDDPNENLKMVVVSYDNYVVSRYINTWDDTTYFGGKRFSTNKYAFHENRNFFLQGNLYTGILYGYGNNAAINIKGIAPAVFPTIGAGYKNTSVEMAYIPTPSGGVFLSLFKYSF
jgi:hypothetical protein